MLVMSVEERAHKLLADTFRRERRHTSPVIAFARAWDAVADEGLGQFVDDDLRQFSAQEADTWYALVLASIDCAYDRFAESEFFCEEYEDWLDQVDGCLHLAEPTSYMAAFDDAASVPDERDNRAWYIYR